MTTGNEALSRQLMDLFLQEVRERTAEFERNLLGLENASDHDTRNDFRTRLLRIAHSMKGAAGLLGVKPIEEACHHMEDLLLRGGDAIGPSTLDLLLAATDAIAESGRMLERGEGVDNQPLAAVLGTLAAEAEALAIDSRRKVPASKEPVPARRRQSDAAVARPSDSDGSMRVSADRLDSLLYSSGELLAYRSRSRMRAWDIASLRDAASALRQNGKRRNLPPPDDGLAVIENGLRDLARGLADDDRLLHSTAMALDADVRKARLQPFAQSCEGLGRLVRDMCASQNKSASLSVEGGGVEIDRSILGVLHDALRHLVRNAVGHGLETREARRAAGKPETGVVAVSASIQGQRLQVSVRDDGRGIDLEAVRKLADRAGIQNGLDERALLRQVFMPGVSTSPIVTKLSGRGIGLDVVRSAVERLRGEVEVSSVPGEGSTFTMTLPLTLATVQALLIRAGSQIFAIDSASVTRLVREPLASLRQTDGRGFLVYAGRTIPLLDLSGWLDLPPQLHTEHPRTVTAVILGPDGGESAVLVDEVTGEQELLARTLGPRLARIRGYSGAAILPDGKVALILNAAALQEAAITKISDLAPAGLQKTESAKTRVLVVDDTPAIRSLEKLILETAGYEVAMASNGAEAWEHLQAHGADAVIADVDMPVMDGFMLTRTIRGSESFRNLPVILVTARDTTSDKTRGMDAGADAYLAKSGFDQQHFLEILRQVV